jgi:5-aminopentanamidase
VNYNGPNASSNRKVLHGTGAESEWVMGNGRIVLGGVQLAGIQCEKARNVETAERLIRAAAAQGAQVVMTPEVVLTGFVGGEVERQMAEPIPGPSTRRFGDLARELDVYVMVGLSESWDGQVYNAMAIWDRNGELLDVMRKVHINKFETGGGWRNGSRFPVWELHTDSGTMQAGMMICYDREVPESARLLMLQGAEVILNPLACTCPTDDIHRCLLRTRAFENEAYVFVVNHAAPRLNGHSMLIDFHGTIVQELGEDEAILLCTVDLDALEEHRAGGIYGKHHRRPELYGLLCDPAGQIHPADANLPR